MRSCYLIAVLFVGLFAKAQKDSIKGNQYQLEAKIIGKINLTPDCGYFAYATVIEFQIAKFTDLNYLQNNIGVIFTCPEFYGKDFFEVGKSYKVRIADENQAQFGWKITGLNLLEKYKVEKRLWAISAEKLK